MVLSETKYVKKTKLNPYTNSFISTFIREETSWSSRHSYVNKISAFGDMVILCTNKTFCPERQSYSKISNRQLICFYKKTQLFFHVIPT